MRVADFGVARALAEAAWTEPAGAMVGTARVHLARGGRGQAGRRPGRRLLAGPGALRGGDGHRALRDRHDHGDPGGAHRPAAAARPRWGPSTTSWPGRPHLRSGPGSTPRDWQPGWARWPPALPTPAPLPLVTPHLEDSLPYRRSAPRASRSSPSRARRPAPARPPPSLRPVGGAPIGTRAGPGEIFDAEPSGRGAPSRARAVVLGRRTPSSGPPCPVAPAHLADGGRGGRRGGDRGGRTGHRLLAGVFTPSHPTPQLVGLPLAQARADVDKVHMDLRLSGSPVKSLFVGAGDVVSQSPKSGVSKKEGTTVSVVVSGGKPDVTVPSLANMTCATPLRRCRPCIWWPCARRGLRRFGEVHRRHRVVERLHPEPDQAPYGSTITIVALPRTPAGHGAHHPDDLHLRAGAGGAGGGRADGDGATRPRRPCPGNVISTRRPAAPPHPTARRSP